MRVKTLITVLLMFYCKHLICEETWIREYDPFYEAIFKVEDVIVCSDGGYAINGTCIDQETTMGWGFVIKTDSEGNLLWAEKDIVDFQAENDSRAFVETEDGGFLSSSYWWSNGTALIKRDSSGEQEWAELLAETAIESFYKTSDGNFIGAGRKRVSETFWPNLIKISQNGNQIWVKNYVFDDYGYGNINAVIQSLDGGFLLTGSLYSGNNSDLLIIKTNSIGDTLWTRVLNETDGDDIAKTIIEIDNGEIFVGGYLQNAGGFLWKLDNDGNTIWFESGNESCGYGYRSFAKSNDGSVISYFGDLEVNRSLRKFDNDYNIEWTNQLPYFTGQGDKAIGTTANNQIMVALMPNYNAGIAKLNSEGLVSIEEEIITQAMPILDAYPNPFNPAISFSFNIETNSEIKLKIFNFKGQLVSTIDKGIINKGNHTVNWQANTQASGIFLVRLESDNRVIGTKKITLIK